MAVGADVMQNFAYGGDTPAAFLELATQVFLLLETVIADVDPIDVGNEQFVVSILLVLHLK